MRRVFVRFLEESEDTKKTFRNYLTFSHQKLPPILHKIGLNSTVDHTYLSVTIETTPLLAHHWKESKKRVDERDDPMT